MSRRTFADGFVRGIRDVSAGITGGKLVDPLQAMEHGIDAPETSAPECNLLSLRSGSIGRRSGRVVHRFLFSGSADGGKGGQGEQEKKRGFHGRGWEK